VLTMPFFCIDFPFPFFFFNKVLEFHFSFFFHVCFLNIFLGFKCAAHYLF
jgi:hypothetical protein